MLHNTEYCTIQHTEYHTIHRTKYHTINHEEYHTIGRGVVTLLQLPALIAQKLILLSCVSSKPFSDRKSVEISRTAPRFSKIPPHRNFFRKISKLS